VALAFTAGKRAVLEMHRSCHRLRRLMLPGRPEHAKGHARWFAEKLCKRKAFGVSNAAFTGAVACGPRLATQVCGAADRPMKGLEHLS